MKLSPKGRKEKSMIVSFPEFLALEMFGEELTIFPKSFVSIEAKKGLFHSKKGLLKEILWIAWNSFPISGIEVSKNVFSLLSSKYFPKALFICSLISEFIATISCFSSFEDCFRKIGFSAFSGKTLLNSLNLSLVLE